MYVLCSRVGRGVCGRVCSYVASVGVGCSVVVVVVLIAGVWVLFVGVCVIPAAARTGP